jgi:aspartate racemase
LRDWLRSKLPEYMVPALFMTLETLPLTPNGKVNRKALPSPLRTNVETSSRVVAPRDALEQQLVKIWEKVLQVHPVGLRDNFFDLGGHSLTAVRLFAEVRKQTGRNLPLATLFQAPTVEQLAECLRKDGWSPHWSSLVPIQPGGSKTPLFCVHGGGGNVLLFRDLARHLGSDYPFFGLQSQGLDGKGNYLTTVAEMASHYLKEIRELQPEGPYYLGGFCMGGAVALEMAQRLLEQNQEVRLLAMFDTYNHNGTAPGRSFADRLRYLRQKAQFHWANITQLPSKERIGYLAEKFRGTRQRGLANLTLKLANLPKLFGSRVAKPMDGIALEDVNDQAGFSYRPKTYPGAITLFLPQRNYYFVGKPGMGWPEFAAGGLNVIELPVYPGGMFVEPYVRALADKLRACIDEAEKPPAAQTPVPRP